MRCSHVLKSVVALAFTTVVLADARAYKPEIGDVIDDLPVVQPGGAAVDWNAMGAGAPRLLVIGASWCAPCKNFLTWLPSELARLRERGFTLGAFYVEADNFTAAAGPATNTRERVDSQGYVTLVPDPTRLQLSSENPQGVRQWGSFKIYAYPTVFLLDERNAVVSRYRNGTPSREVFSDAAALLARTASSGKPGAQLPARP